MSTAEAYVTALDHSLVGPRRVRRGLVQEARDHLDDASAALSDAGYDRAEAERIAVADFGELDEVVPAFQTTLAVAASRRTALMLLLVLSIQPFLWDGPLGPDHGPPPDGVVFSVLDHAVEYGGSAMILVALGLLVASGIGNRWFTAGRGIARLTAITTLASAASIKLIGLAMVVLSSGTEPGPWLLFLVFIVVPFSVTGTQARRTLALC
ncbi:MAG TPA: permease prefix domain 1-containing protein [Nocardioides sp.]|nr:permease prefix domain 1-containing protein [Nocardioides sp.]